jgi:hypothetical protein
MRLSFVFAENILIKTVRKGFREGRDIMGTQGVGGVDVIRTVLLSIHCHQ